MDISVALDLIKKNYTIPNIIPHFLPILDYYKKNIEEKLAHYSLKLNVIQDDKEMLDEIMQTIALLQGKLDSDQQIPKSHTQVEMAATDVILTYLKTVDKQFDAIKDAVNSQQDAFVVDSAKYFAMIAMLIDALVHGLYIKIDEVLGAPDFLKKDSDLFFKLHEKILEIEEYISCVDHKLLIFFKKIDHSLIPLDSQTCPEKYLMSQYEYFMKDGLNFCSDKKNNEYHRVSCWVRSIMSRPVGQRLILRLNQFIRNGLIISIKSGLRFSVTPQPESGTALENLGIFKDSSYKSFSKQQYKYSRIVDVN